MSKRIRARKTILLYKKHSSLREWKCFYCGDFGNTKDHIPAISYARFFPEAEKILVRACYLCNTGLGNKPFNTLQTRCEFLLKYYKRKYKKYLSQPHWSDEEMDEINGSLQSTIHIAMKNKRYAEEKINYLKNNIDYLMGVMTIDLGETEEVFIN